MSCHSLSACSDTIDNVKQSAALCLLRLIRSAGDAIPMGEWASRVIHLLNDQHMVSARSLLTALDTVCIVISLL